MTQPKIDTVKQFGSRFYLNPLDPKERLPGVTSVLDMLPKPFLRYWMAKVVAETAVDNVGAVVDMMLGGDRTGAIDYLKRSPGRNTGKAADVGNDVHSLVESLARGEKIGAVHPDIQPYVNGWRDFNEAMQPEYLFIEETVWSHTHGYAGSFDAICVVEGETIILDNKTTRSGVHGEVALQMTAYKNADYILRADGEQVPIPDITGAAVLHLRPEATELVPVHTSDALMDVFVALLQIHKWDKDLSRGVVGKPLGSWKQ
jgi:hypothetical protein